MNPTISRCFWCGEDKNEIALLGAAYPKEAPMHMVLNYEPCDKCKGHMSQGITLIQASPNPMSTTQPPLQEGVYPTGKWAVVTEQGIKAMITEPMASQVLKTRKAFLDPIMWEKTGLDTQEEQHEP